MPAKRCSRRRSLSDAALSREAAADYAARCVAGRCFRSDARTEGRSVEEMKKYRLGPLYTPPTPAGNSHSAGHPRRGELGRRRVRSRYRTPVCENE